MEQSIYITEKDKLMARIRNLETENKELRDEIRIVKLRIAAIENVRTEDNERKPSGKQTKESSSSTVRKGKKAVATPV